jgi:uncharacterized protein
MLGFMQIVNVTRQTTLAHAVRLADNPLTRFMGLLGKREFPAGQALVLRPCSGIHMLGMRFAIDALYLDARRQVIHAVRELGPWRIGPLDPATACVVEMPAGTIAATATAVGDEIAFPEE